jgi:hypothetical protein
VVVHVWMLRVQHRYELQSGTGPRVQTLDIPAASTNKTQRHIVDGLMVVDQRLPAGPGVLVDRVIFTDAVAGTR